MSSFNATRSVFEALLDYRFKDEQWLQKALTHPSYSGANYQRLEFLGDAALDLAFSALAFSHHPDASEGQLTQLRQKWVCTSALAEMTRSWPLEQHLLRGQALVLPLTDAIRADVLEALLGAVFADGGLDQVSALVSDWFELAFIDLESQRVAELDSKGQLQHYLHQHQLKAAHYSLVEQGGPDHAKWFTVSCDIGSERTSATANRLRAAEKKAAAAMLQQLQQKPS